MKKLLIIKGKLAFKSYNELIHRGYTIKFVQTNSPQVAYTTKEIATLILPMIKTIK